MLSTVDDVRQVEARPHGLAGLVYARPPEGGEFRPLIVVNGSVSWREPGSLPGRSCTVRVMSWDTEQRHVTDYVSPLGTWIRLAHHVVRPGNTTFDVPLGTFRVDRIAVDELAGTVDIEGSDAGALVGDYDLPLNAGEVLATTAYSDAAATMLNAVLAGIPPWWSQGGVSTAGASPIRPATRLQFVGSRVDAVVELATGANALVATPIDDSYAFRLVAPTSPTAPAVITIRPGAAGNMVSHVHSFDREGLANVALMTYTVQTKQGNQTVTTQRRLQIEYTQAGADVRAGGPFGRVTMDVDSTNVTTDAQASTVAQNALKSRLSNTSDIALNISPIYGLELGDPVKVERADGTATPGQVVGATIGLTAADPWTVTVRSFLALPAGAFSRPAITTAPVVGARQGGAASARSGLDPVRPRDDTTWRDFEGVTVDLTCNTPGGWSLKPPYLNAPPNATIHDGGSRLRIVGDTDSLVSGYRNVKLLTAPTFGLTWHRIRVLATVFAGTQDVEASAMINIPVDNDELAGDPIRVYANTSALVSLELDPTWITDPFQAGAWVSPASGWSSTEPFDFYVSNVVVQWTDESIEPQP